MKKYIFISSILVIYLNSSTLEVYQDQSFYKLESKTNFIGFAKDVEATCNDEDVELKYSINCPTDDRLCKIYNSIKEKKEAIDEASANIATIDTLISTKVQESIDADKILESAKIIAKEKSKLKREIANNQSTLKLLSNNFSKIAPSNEPLYLSKECDGKLKITIPYSYINFKPTYEAYIEDNNIKVIQKVEITNRSGIDISAKEAKLYFKQSKEYISPINFSPWIASEYKRVLYKKRAKPNYIEANIVAPAPKMASTNGQGGNLFPVELVGKYNDAREYTLENLNLPSSTTPTKVKILEYKSRVDCKLKVYPYTNRRVFKVCSFKPKYQIDTNRWRVKVDDKLINKDAIGRYENSKYSIYTQVDKDIKVIRKRIVSKERQSGIFGSTRKQKDGYKLIITNKSNKEKELKIIERIPTSNIDKIEVKLLSIKPNIDYKLSKNGKLEINLELSPNEHKTIEVMFELSYDKDLRVSY